MDYSEDITGTESFNGFEDLIPDIKVGTIINEHYRIESFIAKGGFGRVYRVVDIKLNSILAIKILKPHLIENKKKFLRVLREIKLSRKVTDKRVIKIYSLEQWKGLNFLVMEYIEGKSLKDLIIEKGPLKWLEFRGIFFDILKGVEALHKENIIHRDIKPSNIMITKDNEVKILDFGLAKELDDVEKTSTIGEIVGSPMYISPEQIRGEKLNKQSDIYQLGLILFFVLTAQHPFEGNNTMEIINKQLTENPPKLKIYGKKTRKFIEYGLEKAIEKNIKSRFQRVEEMRLFFVNERLPIIKIIYKKILHSPIRYLLTGIFFLILLVYLYFFSFGSKKIHKTNYSDSKMTASNWTGVELFKKEFTNYRIAYAGKLPQIKNNDLINLSLKNNRLILLLSNDSNGIMPRNQSFSSFNNDSKVMFLDSKGEEIRNGKLIKFSYLDTHDFSKTSGINYVKKIYNTDLGEILVIFVRQSRSMYPSSLVFYHPTYQSIYTNPGGFDYKILDISKKQWKYYIFGNNNSFAHLKFFSEQNLNFENRIDNQIKTGILNYTNSEIIDLDCQILLPFNSKISSDTWKVNGKIVFIDEGSGDKLILNNKYQLIRKNSDSETRYFDSKVKLKEIYQIYNKYFVEKNKNQNFTKALALINKALGKGIENPYLKSALLYFRGDLEIEIGKYQKGKISLENAIKLYPENSDAVRRILELEVVKENINDAIKLLQTRYSYINNFYGFYKTGKKLFLGYCYLQLGLFNKAELSISDFYGASNGSTKIIFVVLDLFRGNYIKAFNNIKNIETGSYRNFTVLEYRIIAARSMILAEKDLKLAEFYFSDTAKFSSNYKHFCNVSLAYLLAKKGKIVEAEDLAITAFNKVLERSKGDLQTRLWLFYDAYIFGKTMELIKNIPEVKRGYKECIKANPFTELANRARLSLKKHSKSHSGN